VYALDHGHTKEEQEPLEEPTPAEETANAELTDGKHRCIPLIILDFFFNHYFMLCILCIKLVGVDCHLSCILLSFQIILDYTPVVAGR
jgi:hypothetical protein